MSRLTVTLTVLVVATPCLAQRDDTDGTALRGQSDRTYKRLAEAEKLLLAGKAADAADEIQRVLDEAGDDLVSADGQRFRPARVVAQRVLVRLRAAVLRAYRDQVDGPARQLVEAGKKSRDPRPLRAAVDRYFVSRPAEEALLLLGELAFERGEFRTAEGFWRRLLPNPDPDADPSYPDPRTDPAAVRARLVLSAIFLGELDRARTELAALRADHPKAGGRLAGKDGPFADTLAALLDGSPVVVADPAGGGAWTGFAGGPARDSRVGGRLPYYWPSRPTWAAPIPRDTPRPRAFPGISSPTAVAFHPVVLDGVGYLADAVRVHGFDLQTGQSQFFYDLRTDADAARLGGLRVAVPTRDAADHTLAAVGGRLYARLGGPVADPKNDTGPQSWLVGFAPPAGPRPAAPLEVRWKLPPPAPADAAATWEAAPVAADGRLFAAFARFDGNRMTHAVACYTDPPSDRPVWVTEVFDGPRPAAPRHRPEPLTLAGGNVVFCSHTGLAVALDAATGRPAWAFRYPRPDRAPAVSPRDLAPAVAADGRVFLAPADADRVFALDAQTGRLEWQSDPMQADQLLGVSRGRLIVTVAGPNRGIRGLDAATGSDRAPAGWRTHDDPHLKSFGRGLLSDDLVVWPTQEALFFLNPADGTPVRPPVRRPHGNLAFADGVILAATPTELWGYVPDAPPAAPHPGREWAEWTADRAETALKAGDRDEARRLLEASFGDATPSWQAWAVGRLLSLEPPGGREAALARFMDRVARTPGLGDEFVYGPDGVPVRLRHLAERHFGAPRSPPRATGAKPPTRPPTPNFDIGALHGLGPDLAVEREVAFRGVPLLPFADTASWLFTSDGSHVFAYRPGSVQPAWDAPLPPGLAVTHAAVVGDSVVSAGPHGVAALRLADGSRGWFFRLPDADPLPEHGPQTVPRSAVPAAGPSLSGFAAAGSRLVARAGDHHLLALDLHTGDVAWVLDGRGRNRLTLFPLDTDPRFGSAFSTDDRFVVAQLSTGRRWTVAADSGRVVNDTPTAPVEWSGPPAALGDGRVAVADGPELVRVVDPSRGRVVWTTPLGGRASLTGRPPQFRPVPGGLVVAAFHNHGVEIDRLTSGGGRAWRGGPAFLAAGDADLAAADTDGAHLYVPADGRVHALRLADGGESWAADLGAETGVAGRWRVRAGRRAVVAYPAEAVPEESVAAVAGRAAGSFAARPLPRRVPALAAGLYDAWAARTVPVLVLDPETGRVARRLDLPAVGPVVVADLAADRAAVATAGRLSLLK